MKLPKPILYDTNWCLNLVSIIKIYPSVSHWGVARRGTKRACSGCNLKWASPNKSKSDKVSLKREKNVDNTIRIAINLTTTDFHLSITSSVPAGSSIVFGEAHGMGKGVMPTISGT